MDIPIYSDIDNLPNTLIIRVHHNNRNLLKIGDIVVITAAAAVTVLAALEKLYKFGVGEEQIYMLVRTKIHLVLVYSCRL
jgi:hypothetical protein